LVKWKACIKPKKLGGLGIKDLGKFGWALQLRWLWFKWDVIDRPWKKLLTVHDKEDRALFFASTEITVGHSENTPFWEGRWLLGTPLKLLAPNLYKQGRYKLRSVSKELHNFFFFCGKNCTISFFLREELHNFNWIKSLKQVNSVELVDEFILLFSTLSEVQLNDDKDVIR
jgi:hypothetical protein